MGFTVFNFTVLLHEVVHHTIFERWRPTLDSRDDSLGTTKVTKLTKVSLWF